jgi:hypothetical protein
LIIPKTYGVPVAFLGVPNTELPAAAAAVVLLAAGVLEPPELLELLELQPAATSPVTASASALSHMGRFIFASFMMVESLGQGSWVWLEAASSGGRLPEVTGGEQFTPLAEFGGSALEPDPAMRQDVGTIGDLQRQRDVLLDEKHACAQLVGGPAQDRDQAFDDHRS